MNLNLKKSLIILVGILLLGGFLRIYKLDNASLRADEFIGANISYGLKQSGEWKFWNWNNEEMTGHGYTRGQVYYWQSAQVLKFLPPTEFNFRLVSVLWGIFGIALIFGVGYFYSRNFVIALLSALLWAISLSAITFDRHFRMYSMFAPVYLGLSVVVFQFLESAPKKAKGWIDEMSLKTGLNWKYFLLVLVLLILSFATHLLSINIFPVIAVYIFLLALWGFNRKGNWKNKYTWLLLIPLASLPVLFFSGLMKKALNFFGFMENNFGHIENITFDYSHALIALTFLVIGAFVLIRENLKKGLWLLLSFLVPLFLAIFFWDRSSGAQYIYFIQTFQTILIAAGIYFAASRISEILLPKKWYQFFQKKNQRGVLLIGGIILYLLLILYNFSYFSDPDSFYQESRKWDRSNYRQVFAYYLKHREKDALLITRDFRNYYYSKAHIPVFDFGGEHKPERKLTLEKLKKLETENPVIWIVIDTNDHDYIRGEARKYIRSTYRPIETTYTNDSMEIWKWEKSI